MIRLESAAEGTVVCVRAQPGSRKNAIVGEHDGALKIAVTAPPDKGKANEAIVAVLAEAVCLPKSAIQLVSGQTSRQKKFLLSGLSPDCVERAIVRLFDG